jgi:hypothetical protein
MHLAELNLKCGSLDRALHHADKTLHTAREHDLWELGDACLISARVRMQMGQVDEAQALAEQAIECFESKNLPHKVALARNFCQQLK